MSRTVRNWCDICRDLQPDIACTTDGCGKKFHEDCLRNAGLWRAEDTRADFVCPECRESNTNESFCYICKKELIVAKKRRKKSDGGPPPKRVTRADTAQTSSEPSEPAVEAEAREEEEGESGVSAAEEGRPRRSRRAAALKAAAAAAGASDESDEEKGRLKKSDMTANEDFVLCDGCSNSAHLRCLGLTALPQEGDSDLWFCTECDPNSATATSMARQEAERRAAALKSSNANAATSKNKLGGNVDICYVCQKSGKLLGCDFCEQSFHPRCIDAEFLEFEEAPAANAEDTPSSMAKPDSDKWRCPICKGEDPLKNMAHKRLSRTAMLKLSREWQECIRVAHRKCRLNRDRFLWNCRDTLLPFVTQKTINRLKKQFAPNSRWPETKSVAVPKARTRGRKQAARVDTDDTTESEESEREESQREIEIAALKSYRAAERAAKKREETLLKEGVHLKSYQIIGVGWLLNAFTNKAGAILADEMGLGKTIQCLTFLSALKALDLTGPHLIVVPLSTVGNWAREIRKFVPHLKFVKICGSRFEREHTMADATAAEGLYDLYITTYETVVTEESFFCDNFSWQTLILDEAHRIKNESGRIRHSLDRVAANMRVLLTGTPLQNNVKELFTLLNFLFPDVLKDSDTFEKVFSSKPTGPQSVVDQAAGINETLDATAITAVTHLLGKMMLRRTKDLVVRLPKKYEHDIWIPLSPLSAFWYKKLLDVSEAAFQQQLVKKLLGTVVKMRICCCHPRGLVTRDAQLTRFKEAFMCLEGEDDITEAANALIDLEGEEHIRASSKLVVLDKLLTQLHIQNVAVSEPYRRDYVQNVKDLYVQTHPPPPLQPIKPDPKDVAAKRKSAAQARRAAAAAADNIQETSQEPKLPNSQPPGSETKDSNLADPGTGQMPSASEPPRAAESPGTASASASTATVKPLTARQISERTRRERAAQAAQQQAEMEEALERIGETALTALQPTARDQDLFFEMMLPAIVPDAPLPQLPETSDQEDAGEHDEDIGDTSEPEDEDAARVKEQSNLHDSNETEPENEMEENVIDAVKKEETETAARIESVNSEERKLREAVAHKVLVFTQFQLVLDELERYCQFRGFKYLRLDGSTNKMIRELDIREFNSPQSTHLVYLICTRAGGVGINLVTANHVLLYDEDWNPFIDLQAIDRAHRIGQKRDVHVWKLITEWTVEERMAFRRMQKLKLDKLLIQANTANDKEAAAAAEEAAEGELDPAAADEKFSVEEIHRLIRHGRTAIQKVSGTEDERLWDKPLEEVLERERRSLPVITDEIEGNLEDEDATGDDINRVSLVEALEPEDREICMPGPTDERPSSAPEAGIDAAASRTTSTDEVDETDGDTESMVRGKKRKRRPAGDESDMGASAEGTGRSDMEMRRATRRLRRRQPLLFQPAPVEPVKPRVERKVVHDKKCFRCGSGVNLADEAADPLVPCHRCPKVYHKQGCLGFDELPKKTWTCAWHECCLCFRKGSQAGGLLIHCAECPTTFCFDCFPPEYRRYNPPATYYADLTKRGYPTTPEKLVLFLCSRCKALKEQARRRLLSRQQLEAEAKKRKEANLKARVDAQKAKDDQTKGGTLPPGSVKQSADQRREFQQRKKKIDDIDRQFNQEIRAAYEKLFPQDFMDAIVEKRNVLAKQQQQSTTETHEGIPVPLTSEEAKPSDQPDGVGEPSPGEIGAGDAQPQSQSSQTPVPPKHPPKVQAVKSPGEFLKLCENCHLPGHDSSCCPFPSETEKKNMASTTPSAVPEEDKAGEKLRGSGTKRLIRSFCPKCGVSSRNHFRRHCDLLTEEDTAEYESRREKIQSFIRLVQAATPVDLSQTSYRGANILANLEGCRRALQKIADDTVNQCLTEADLSNCVGGAGSGTLRTWISGGSGSGQLGGKRRENGGEKARRKRSRIEMGSGEGEKMENAGGDTDDPSYSPRKKTRTTGGDSGGDHVEEGDEASDGGTEPQTGRTRRPRRTNPRVNFRELEASPVEDDNAPMEEPTAAGEQGLTIDLRRPPSSPALSKRAQRRPSTSPRIAPHPGLMRRPSYEDPRLDGATGKGPTFSTIGPPRFPTVVTDQSRLPPSRWHHGPAAAAPVAAGRISAAAAQMMGAQVSPWGYAPHPSMMNVAPRGYYPAPMLAPGQWAPISFAQQQAAAEMWRAQQYAAAAAAAQQHHHRPPPGPPT